MEVLIREVLYMEVLIREDFYMEVLIREVRSCFLHGGPD
jgi:hypothetical protein